MTPPDLQYAAPASQCSGSSSSQSLANFPAVPLGEKSSPSSESQKSSFLGWSGGKTILQSRYFIFIDVDLQGLVSCLRGQLQGTWDLMYKSIDVLTGGER